MLLFSLLAKVAEKIDQGNKAVVEELFARKNCSTDDLRNRIEKARLAREKMLEKINVR